MAKLMTIDETAVEKVVSSFIAATVDYMEAARQLVDDMSVMNEATRQEVVDGIVQQVPQIRDWVERMASCAARGLIDSSHLYDHTRLATSSQIMRSTPKAIMDIQSPEREFEIVNDDGSVYLRKASDMNSRELCKCWSQSNGALTTPQQREVIKRRLKTIAMPKGTKVKIKSAGLTNEDGRQYVDLVVSDCGVETCIALPVDQLRRFLK